MSVMASVAVSQVGMTELIFVNHGVKVNGQYYCDVLLSQQMLPAISGGFNVECPLGHLRRGPLV